MELRAVLLQQREVSSSGVYGGDGADLDELAAAVDHDAGERGAEVGGAEVGLGNDYFEFDPLLLKHADAGLGLVVSLFCAFRAAVGIEDGVAGGLGQVEPGGGVQGGAQGGCGGGDHAEG